MKSNPPPLINNKWKNENWTIKEMRSEFYNLNICIHLLGDRPPFSGWLWLSVQRRSSRICLPSHLSTKPHPSIINPVSTLSLWNVQADYLPYTRVGMRSNLNVALVNAQCERVSNSAFVSIIIWRWRYTPVFSKSMHKHMHNFNFVTNTNEADVRRIDRLANCGKTPF